MKKYLLGITALVFAIAFSAFTKPKFTNDRIFQLKTVPAAFPTESNVETVSNWVSTNIDPSCLSGSEFQPCKILVSDQYYHETFSGSGVYELNTSTTQAGVHDQAFVRATITQSASGSIPELAKVVSNDGTASTIVTITNQNKED